MCIRDSVVAGAAIAIIAFALSLLLVRDTAAHVSLEQARDHADQDGAAPPLRDAFAQASYRDPALRSCSQAGLVNNLNDGLAWGLFPLWFARDGLSVARIGVLVALYPAVWGVAQLITGALSDRVGRKPLIAGGMFVQAVAIALIAETTGFGPWALAAILLGVGTAMVYPTLLAAISDVAHPRWRARSVGVYRLWRDAGFATGALLAGITADAFGLRAAIWTVAALTAASGLVVMIRMYETVGTRIAPAAEHANRRQ